VDLVLSNPEAAHHDDDRAAAHDDHDDRAATGHDDHDERATAGGSPARGTAAGHLGRTAP
jgi:hypothetical protein